MKSMRFIISALLSVLCLHGAWATEKSAAEKSPGPAPSKTQTHGSLSPSAPVNLAYHINDSGVAGQPVTIDIAIGTRLMSGTLLIEVAKQEGATLLDAAAQRIDLATVARPITLQLRAIPTAQSESFIVLLLTVETEMGPMSRSFRIDLAPPAVNDNAA